MIQINKAGSTFRVLDSKIRCLFDFTIFLCVLYHKIKKKMHTVLIQLTAKVTFEQQTIVQ